MSATELLPTTDKNKLVSKEVKNLITLNVNYISWLQTSKIPREGEKTAQIIQKTP